MDFAHKYHGWCAFMSFWLIEHLMVDGCRSKLVNVVSGVLQRVFWDHYCSSCTPRIFFHTEAYAYWLCRWLHFDSRRAIPCCIELQLQSPWTITSARLVSGVTFAGWNWIGVRLWQWCRQVTHNPLPVTPINYWCAAGVWWPWYIWSDIQFKDDFCEAS